MNLGRIKWLCSAQQLTFCHVWKKLPARSSLLLDASKSHWGRLPITCGEAYSSLPFSVTVSQILALNRPIWLSSLANFSHQPLLLIYMIWGFIGHYHFISQFAQKAGRNEGCNLLGLKISFPCIAHFIFTIPVNEKFLLPLASAETVGFQ